MNLTNELLHQLADPKLTDDERARLRCQLAKQLEEAGNYEAAREAMGDLWRGVGHSPAIKELDQASAAEVILRAGVLTGWIGSCRQIEGAQETARNLISESIALFEKLQDTEKIAEAETDLAICYWREGAYDNARALLKEALSRVKDKEGEVKTLALLRSAIVEKSSGNYNAAFRIHTEAAPLFEISSNDALKGKFHNSFANVLENLGAAEKQVDYIDRALIEYAAASFHFEQAGHTRYQARVENNLGYLFGRIHKFPEAHHHLDRAQALFTSLKDKAHIAQVDDTRAKVLLEDSRVTEAEKFARAAVRTLEADDQQALLAEALLTHGIALARLNHPTALLTLQRASEIAETAGDSEAAGLAALTTIEELDKRLTADELKLTYERAVELLAGSRNLETHMRLSACARQVLFLLDALPTPWTWHNFSLKEALRRYEGRIIARALKDAGGIVTRAAHLLGFSHHTIINRINLRYPELLAARTPVTPRKRSLMYIKEPEVIPKKLAILHIEDNKLVAEAVRDTLAIEDWSIENVYDGIEALQRLISETHYDALIFGNKITGTRGVELIRQARRITHRQHTPIIVLASSDVEKEARRAGANEFLKKPEGIKVITATIAQLLARKRRS